MTQKRACSGTQDPGNSNLKDPVAKIQSILARAFSNGLQIPWSLQGNSELNENKTDISIHMIQRAALLQALEVLWGTSGSLKCNLEVYMLYGRLYVGQSLIYRSLL